jgi:hypothetical protein
MRQRRRGLGSWVNRSTNRETVAGRPMRAAASMARLEPV